MSKILLVSLVHNRKHLLPKCVLSALNQTYRNFDHLLFDNNSIDGAREVAKTFSKKYNNIHFFGSETNLGQQSAYNHVLNVWIPKNMPEAEIMVILDSDDELMPNALHEVSQMYNAHPEIGGSYSGFALIDRKGRFIVKDHGKAKMVPNQFTQEGQKMLRKMFVGSNPCGHLRVFRTNILKDVGGFNTEYTYATDYNVFGRIMEKYPVVKIDKVLYKFRQHGDQVQGQHSPQQTKDWKDMQKEFTDRWTKMGLI